jgi:NAD(P)-dependent dehydrogenase (short-subunit alcohol dehydrogenase family)
MQISNRHQRISVPLGMSFNTPYVPAAELTIRSVHFAECDVRQWEEQKAAFRLAASKSSSGMIDVVIANAGISGDDPFLMDRR